MIKASIFDLDGTIADTLDDICDALNGMLTEKHLPTLTRNDVLHNINYGAFELIRRSIPSEYSSDIDFINSCLTVYEKYYSNCYSNKTYPFAGITDAVLTLRRRGVKLAVLSNKQDEFVKNIIKKIFPTGTFDVVLGQGPFPPKPDPSSALHICNILRVEPGECAMVGDSHVDMQTAINAGLYAVGVTWGYRSRQVLIDNGAQLLIDKTDDLISLCDLDL